MGMRSVCLAAWLVVGSLAQASIVTVTITGTVQSGDDYNGNVFSNSGQDTDLTGQPFTLVYTFNDAAGVDLAGVCNGSVAWSNVAEIDTNPGTAKLTINGGTFSFGGGGLGQNAISSSMAVQEYGCPAGVGLPGYGPGSSASIWVQVGYSGDSNTDFSAVIGNPLTSPNAASKPGLITAVDWRSSIKNAALDPNSGALIAFAYVTYSGKPYSFNLTFSPTTLNVAGAAAVLTSLSAMGTNTIEQASGTTLNISSGDVPVFPTYEGNYLTFLPTAKTAYLDPTVTTALTSNPMSECTESLTLQTTPNWNGLGGDGFGVSDSVVMPNTSGTGTCAKMPGGGTSPSGVFRVSAMYGKLTANPVTVIVPPQVMIQTEVGEAGAQRATGDAAMPSLLLVAGYRFGDSNFPPLSHSWQTTLSDPNQFYGDINTTSNGVQPELDYAAAIFNGTTTVTLPVGCECYWSPFDTQFAKILVAYKSGTTTEPTGTGAPICWNLSLPEFKGKMHQIVIKASVQNNLSAAGKFNSPAFTFYQLAPTGSKAVIQVP